MIKNDVFPDLQYQSAIFPLTCVKWTLPPDCINPERETECQGKSFREF